jgi:hypothetical protein
MPDYMIEWEAHIDERKRPENFPRSVFVREHYPQVESDEQLKQIFNARVKAMVVNPGLVVLPDDEVLDLSKLTFDKRIYIPWHMITHFHGRVNLITPQSLPEIPLESLIPQDPSPTETEKKALIQ